VFLISYSELAIEINQSVDSISDWISGENKTLGTLYFSIELAKWLKQNDEELSNEDVMQLDATQRIFPRSFRPRSLLAENLSMFDNTIREKMKAAIYQALPEDDHNFVDSWVHDKNIRLSEKIVQSVLKWLSSNPEKYEQLIIDGLLQPYGIEALSDIGRRPVSSINKCCEQSVKTKQQCQLCDQFNISCTCHLHPLKNSRIAHSCWAFPVWRVEVDVTKCQRIRFVPAISTIEPLFTFQQTNRGIISIHLATASDWFEFCSPILCYIGKRRCLILPSRSIPHTHFIFANMYIGRDNLIVRWSNYTPLEHSIVDQQRYSDAIVFLTISRQLGCMPKDIITMIQDFVFPPTPVSRLPLPTGALIDETIVSCIHHPADFF